MPGIGVIHNPHSRKNILLPKMANILKSIIGDYGMVIVTNSPEEVPGAIEQFKAGEFQGLIANPQSIGTGNDFPMVNYLFFYTQKANTRDYLQAIKRTARAGNKFTVAVNFVVEKTVDEDVLNINERGESLNKYMNTPGVFERVLK